ncbi:hypothetical protein LUZ63_002554 [Rhynchospora breviuscula]|uniref:Erythronate-4-phosphate dehydrogenase family protein n=1 Tax=Rhynchospora breviuscula TaxID=2022672 RepID=A0A9Q0CZ14_9POAL|nr:hypothetical protein LUZ63_002554 [Rhynchospora breviuscula]
MFFVFHWQLKETQSHLLSLNHPSPHKLIEDPFSRAMKPINGSLDGDSKPENGRKIIMHPLYAPRSSPWLDLRVFYIRLSNCELNSSTPDHLTLNHVPLSPDTIIEVNGTRSSIYTEWISSSLRRDRVDKNSEEATYVTTDSMRMTGSVRFEVFDKDDLLLTGDLELNHENGYGTGNGMKKWAIKCQSAVACNGFLKGQEGLHPVIEVYVAGSFSGTPIILTKTIQLGLRKKSQRKIMLETIPENEMVEEEQKSHHDILKVSEYQELKQDSDTETEDNNMYYAREGSEYFEGEDGELSWFNAGVRVGVGIGLGICVGIGIGVGLMVSTYQSTTRNFRRRLL